MHIQKGDKVMVRQDLEYGMGVVQEQLEYRGKEFEVEFEVGYGLLLMNNPFVWKPSDLELIQKGVNQMFGQGYALGAIVTFIGLMALKKFNDISKED